MIIGLPRQKPLAVLGSSSYTSQAAGPSVGGTYRWAWKGPDGQIALTIEGEHREVVPPSRVVHTERMHMGPGAGPCGDSGECAEPWELLATLELTEKSGVTSMKMTLAFGSKQARDGALASGMEHGMEAGYKNLDAFLAGDLP